MSLSWVKYTDKLLGFGRLQCNASPCRPQVSQEKIIPAPPMSVLNLTMLQSSEHLLFVLLDGRASLRLWFRVPPGIVLR